MLAKRKGQNAMQIEATPKSGIVNQSSINGFFAILIVWPLLVATGFSQPPDTYRMYSSAKPPGLIGRQQVKHGRVPAGKTQPIRISAPAGTIVSPAQSGMFSSDHFTPALYGLEVGLIYRFRLTDIPKLDDVELYPSLELIGHLSPPEGKEKDYPVPVVFAIEDLRIAAEGGFVTRVIYVEEPDVTLPGMVEEGDQAYFEVSKGEDPLHVAEVLGRPVAILRIGSKAPQPGIPDHTFTFNSPTVMQYEDNHLVRSLPLQAPSRVERNKIKPVVFDQPGDPKPAKTGSTPLRPSQARNVPRTKRKNETQERDNPVPVPFARVSRGFTERPRR